MAVSGSFPRTSEPSDSTNSSINSISFSAVILAINSLGAEQLARQTDKSVAAARRSSDPALRMKWFRGGADYSRQPWASRTATMAESTSFQVCGFSSPHSGTCSHPNRCGGRLGQLPVAIPQPETCMPWDVQFAVRVLRQAMMPRLVMGSRAVHRAIILGNVEIDRPGTEGFRELLQALSSTAGSEPSQSGGRMASSSAL